MKAIHAIITVIGALCIVGCATTSSPTNPELLAKRIETSVRVVVRSGAIADLTKNPERRPKYEQAAAGLHSMVESKRWDADAFAFALLSTGAATFEDATTVIAVVGSVELFDAVAGESLDLSSQQYVEPAIRGASAGLDAALAATARKQP